MQYVTYLSKEAIMPTIKSYSKSNIIPSAYKITENVVLKAICEYLAIKKYFFWRQNTTPIFDSTKKIFRKMPQYSLRGVADIIMIFKGKTYFIEIKSPIGVLSKEQKEFQKKVEKEGCVYICARSVDDIVKVGL